jgi:Spy/CpxP family protein refolding chaperone
MRLVYTAVASIALVSLVAGPAMAQRQKGEGKGGRGGGGGLAGLLQREEVIEELKLTPDQVAKVKEVAQKVRTKHEADFSALRDQSPSERAEKMQELNKTVTDEVLTGLSETLKPDQVKRIKEIELQTRGPAAFNDPEVAKALNLSDEQKTKIKSINEDLRAEMMSLRPQGGAGGGGAGGGGAFQKMAAARKDGMKKVEKVLNDDQKKTWHEMVGKPFEMRMGQRQRAS